jgi:hypothetical protein
MSDGSQTPAETPKLALGAMVNAVENTVKVYEKALNDLFQEANGAYTGDASAPQPMSISTATVKTTEVQLAQATSELVKGTVDNAVKNIAKLGQKLQGG